MIFESWASLIVAVCLIAGLLFGWMFAHSTVATECEKLGGFYVGNTVYKCEVLK